VVSLGAKFIKWKALRMQARPMVCSEQTEEYKQKQEQKVAGQHCKSRMTLIATAQIFWQKTLYCHQKNA
jgi:hypothetical protein